MKISRKTQKELEQCVFSFSEEKGVPSKESRTDIKGFMRGASSFLILDALSTDELGIVKSSPDLQKVLEEAQGRFSSQLNIFSKKRKA